MQAANAIPDKLFFKIGEVCEICGVQPHVLRYWETEFPQLAPQKNRAGQRVYRRRDVEMVLHIKHLLKDEGYTIAGAKKRLASEMRGSAKLKVVTNETPMELTESVNNEPFALSPAARQALAQIRRDLEHLLTMLRQNAITTSSEH
ncbi:MAG: MerR family transcriptional regulator [candidate division WOR-3 bacterium]